MTPARREIAVDFADCDAAAKEGFGVEIPFPIIVDPSTRVTLD